MIPVVRHTAHPLHYKNTPKRGLFLVLALSLFFYASFTYYAPIPELEFTPSKFSIASQAAPTINWPSVGQYAFGSTDEAVLARSSTNETPVPTASVAKVITALMVTEKKPILKNNPSKPLILTQQDVDLYAYYASVGGSRVAVSIGEEISEQEALTAMLLPSANNMADTLAIWAFGSMANYKLYAQNTLVSWGIRHTQIGSDASGFAPDTLSTASDLILLGQRLMKNDTLRDIVKLQTARIPVAGDIYNTNVLLQTTGAIGIKTGHTDAAGGCLLYAKTYQLDTTKTVTILASAMGATSIQDAFKNLDQLVNSMQAGFSKRTIITAGSQAGTITSKWGTSAKIVTNQDIVWYGWKATELKAFTDITVLEAPLQTRQSVGSIRITSQTGYDTTGNLVTNQILQKPSIFWKIVHPIRLHGVILLYLQKKL